MLQKATGERRIVWWVCSLLGCERRHWPAFNPSGLVPCESLPTEHTALDSTEQGAQRATILHFTGPQAASALLSTESFPATHVLADMDLAPRSANQGAPQNLGALRKR